MANTTVEANLKAKSLELKKWFLDLDAKLEQWKFSVEDTKKGMRVEAHTVAVISYPIDKI